MARIYMSKLHQPSTTRHQEMPVMQSFKTEFTVEQTPEEAFTAILDVRA